MAYRRERIAPTLFLVTGALGFAWGITTGGAVVLGASISLILLGMYAVREIRRDAIEAAKAAANKAARDAEREQIERGN